MPEKKPWKNCNRFSEKLGQKILQLGLNGQKLARKSDVSDSEISRIMNGKSLPGLENAMALARERLVFRWTIWPTTPWTRIQVAPRNRPASRRRWCSG